MSVTDGDEPLSAAWNAVFTIVAGDPGGLFTVKTTESNKHEGIISTAKVGNAVLTLWMIFSNNLSVFLDDNPCKGFIESESRLSSSRCETFAWWIVLCFSSNPTGSWLWEKHPAHSSGCSGEWGSFCHSTAHCHNHSGGDCAGRQWSSNLKPNVEADVKTSSISGRF